MKHKIYVASSWRNTYQPGVVEALLGDGHAVYDFRNPPHGRGGFHWGDIDPKWQTWTTAQYRAMLDSPLAIEGYTQDKSGMQWADTGVLVLPCGRSAHLEAGYFAGAAKPLFVYIPEKIEPELMYGMATKICISMDELLMCLK